MKFTDRSIQAIKPKENRFEAWEDNGRGFGLRVSPKGRKTWIFMYRFSGKPRRMTLGEYPLMKLAEARTAHATAWETMKDGIDPGAVKLAADDEARKAPTVEHLVKEFLEKGVKAKGNRSWKEYKRNLEKDVVPAWRNRKAADIRKRDIILLLEKILERGSPNQSNQVFKIIRRMFNFALERDILEFTPCAGIKFLAPEVRKDRFLVAKEIKALWNALDSEEAPVSEPMKRVFKLILLTLQRPGEVIGAHASEFSGEWWTIPAERSKNKREHRVFLSSMARELFQVDSQDGYLFHSPRLFKSSEMEELEPKPMETNAIAHALRRLTSLRKINGEEKPPVLEIAKFTPHDLRRTGATNLAEMGYSDEIIGAVLNHTRPGVTPIYNRYRYDAEKQQALESWARKLEGILSDKKIDNVIEFRKA